MWEGVMVGDLGVAPWDGLKSVTCRMRLDAH